MNSPFVVVIFGATGDLAQNKLIPALFNLYKQGELGHPPSNEASEGQGEFFIVGFARREFSDSEYSHMLGEELGLHEDPQWSTFAKNIYYQQGIFEESKGYNALVKSLDAFDRKVGACITRLFYLATPPDNYLAILENLKKTKLSDGCGPAFDKLSQKKQESVGQWVRIAIEKPFGRDLKTAKELDARLADIFAEEQIYRVDHYLGKETVQNMIAFRFANSIFEPIWNNKYIDHVQITFAQDEGIGKRGKFFDGVGMLRDIGQNHLLQLLATVAMEQPASFSKEGVRDARADAIKSIRPIKPSEISKYVVRGQYQEYKKEKDVKVNSNTETYTALKLFVDTPRFQDVPFYVRAGKRMEKEVIEISVVFIQTCHLLFKEFGCPEIGNVLTIRIQPNEGLTLRIIAKQPGSKVALSSVDMSFSYHQSFGSHGIDAYEKLLLDIFHGDQMLFNRSDELESTWKLISSILSGWEKSKSKVLIYKSGTSGPKAANDLIEKDSRKWL